MSFADLFRALLFVTFVAAVYAAACGVVARRIRSRAKEPLFGPWRDAAVLLIAASGIGCFAWGFIEPYRPEVTHLRLPVPGISGQDRIRIVQISDVHSGGRPRLEESLPDSIARQSPDLIVFTGDALRDPGGVPVFQRFIRRVSAIAPTFAVLGNWDTLPAGGMNLFSSAGIRVLDGEFVDVEVRGQRVRLVGAAYGESLRMERAVRAARSTLRVVAAKTGGPVNGVPPGNAGISPNAPAAVPAVTLQTSPVLPPIVALAHSPDAIEDSHFADLLLAGHTHGGQIRLPWYGALITLTTTGKKYESGLHRAGRTWVYTNRGIGVEPLLPVRFLCRPEVTVIDLVAQP